MAFLLVPILDRSIRQDDVRMIGIVQLRRRKCLSCIDGNSLMDNDGPAIELPASLGGQPVANILCFRWRSHVETVNRDFSHAFRLQKHIEKNTPPVCPLCLAARKHASTEIFPRCNLSSARHAASVFRSASSSSASRTNPSGSCLVSEYRARRCAPFIFTRQSAPPSEPQSKMTEHLRSPGASIAISPSGVGYTSKRRWDISYIARRSRRAFFKAFSDG